MRNDRRFSCSSILRQVVGFSRAVTAVWQAADGRLFPVVDVVRSCRSLGQVMLVFVTSDTGYWHPQLYSAHDNHGVTPLQCSDPLFNAGVPDGQARGVQAECCALRVAVDRTTGLWG